MNSKQATRRLAAYAAQKAKGEPLFRQIELFESLSATLPTERDRQDANDIAHRLAEAAHLADGLAQRLASLEEKL